MQTVTPGSAQVSWSASPCVRVWCKEQLGSFSLSLFLNCLFIYLTQTLMSAALVVFFSVSFFCYPSHSWTHSFLSLWIRIISLYMCDDAYVRVATQFEWKNCPKKEILEKNLFWRDVGRGMDVSSEMLVERLYWRMFLEWKWDYFRAKKPSCRSSSQLLNVTRCMQTAGHLTKCPVSRDQQNSETGS